MSVGQRVVQIAKRVKNWNPSDLARAVGLSVQAVQQWETGKTSPKGVRLNKIANILGVRPGELIDESIEVASIVVHSNNVRELRPPSYHEQPLTDIERAILTVLRKLPPEKQLAMLSLFK